MLSCPTTRRIISASRRTDIPAFHADWFMRRLRQGFVLAPHPHASSPRRVSLDPGSLLGVVFWSKNPAPLLPRLDELDRRVPNLFFHITITGAGSGLEPGVPPAREVMKDLAFLSRRYSPAHLAWRFDPVCPAPDDPLDAHLERFAEMASKLHGLATTCVTSFATIYGKVARAIDRAGARPIQRPEPAERARFFARMAEAAERFSIRVRVCCDPELPAGAVPAGGCLAPELLAPAWGEPDLAGLPKRPTRKGCACRESVDVGAYDTCPAGCVYCYATNDPNRARANHAAQNPQSPLLGPARD